MTVIASGSALAIKKYSAFLALDVPKKSYFTTRFMSKGEPATMPIQMLDKLENEAGDTISYDLNMQMAMQPVNSFSRLAA